MRGAFDDEEIEPVRPTRNTELTLGSGSLVAMVAGLLLLCGLCFGWGYSVGHESSAPASSAAPPPAPDQEPLQASGSLPKPSAIDQTPMPAPAEPPDTATEAPSNLDPAAANSAAHSVQASAGQAAAQPEVRPALPAAGIAQGSANSAQQEVHSAVPQVVAQQFMVQVAAVANAADAEVLANALKGRGYPVMSKREPADNYVHVRVGPFESRTLAEQWRLQLLNDGYNAQVQP